MIGRARARARSEVARASRSVLVAAARPLRAIDEARERTWEARSLRGAHPGVGELTALLRRNGQAPFSQFAAAQRAGHHGARSFLPIERGEAVERLRASGQTEGIIAVADRLVAGQHVVFGTAADLRRSRSGPGHEVDWRRDPLSGERYGLVFSEWRWDVMGMRPGNADVKGPWEVTRAQHLVTVGQAYWLTGDERYASYFAGWVSDFIGRNPPGLGVHWASNMDVSLRVVGWIAALSFFQGSPALTHRWWRRFLRSLVVHGRHIATHLEFGTIDGRIVTSNHYLSNLLGLHWLALSFPGLDAGVVWRGLAERGLEREIRVQLNDDGSDFESSVPYHRLVTEMFLSAWAMSAWNGTPLSDGYRDRLVRSLEFVRALRQPGGRLPQVGDADDGRAHIFSSYDRWRPESMDHLLVAGAHVFGRRDLAADVPVDARVESIFWPASAEEAPAGHVAPALHFPDAGLAVLRNGPTYLLLANGPVGTEGFGNHKHNDQLSIEWAVGEQPLLVDPGSYTYSQDPDARNRFRGTAMHNTVMIDDVEQHGMNPDWLFRTFAEGDATLEVSRAQDIVSAEGTHTAYVRLDPPVTHRRRVAVLADGTAVVDDLFDGAAGHELRWQLLLHPGVTAVVEGDEVRLEGRRGGGVLRTADLSFRVEDSWYSPGYGRREPALSLVAERSDGADHVRFLLTPSGSVIGDAAAAADELWSSR